MEQLELWEHRQKETAVAIIEGEDIAVVDTEYGYNDFLIEALKESGLWERLTAFNPALCKRNGYEPILLNRVAAVCELL